MGPVVAGIVGQERYQFDIWGDTVNVAARLVGKGKPGCVALTQDVWQRLNDRFEGESLGELDLAGKGTVPVVEVRVEMSRR
jgi:adenylate cyclase